MINIVGFEIEEHIFKFIVYSIVCFIGIFGLFFFMNPIAPSKIIIGIDTMEQSLKEDTLTMLDNSCFTQDTQCNQTYKQINKIFWDIALYCYGFVEVILFILLYSTKITAKYSFFEAYLKLCAEKHFIKYSLPSYNDLLLKGLIEYYPNSSGNYYVCRFMDKVNKKVDGTVRLVSFVMYRDKNLAKESNSIVVSHTDKWLTYREAQNMLLQYDKRKGMVNELLDKVPLKKKQVVELMDKAVDNDEDDRNNNII